MVLKNVSEFYLFLVLISLLQLKSAQSLDIDSAKERPCFEVSKTVPTDLEWISPVKKWYYLLGSRFDLYECASDVAGKDPKKITEDELYYEHKCLHWHFGSDGSLVANGFGKQKSYNIKPSEEHPGAAEFSSTDGDPKMNGVGYNTLTDNKTFMFTVTCYTEQNQTSPYKSLPEETVKLIHDHAESHGFKREYFTGLRHDSCEMDEDDNRQGRGEL